ncbi:hypothetical protein BDZ91DRAFT_797693 [Kalaharituber pfeilii]|nr:hypothetical protein BDZ91DRAFT_797693 [Kalaharituber pfeilii]
MGKEDISLVSSRGSYTPTELSRRTERTSVSVPDDGRAITIHTNRRRRGDDANSTTLGLNAASQTSLLIEYFESGKRVDGIPTSRPSVRVKLTPSKRAQAKSASRDATEVGARESSPRGTRRSSLGNRQMQPLPKGEDRLTLGEDRVDEKYDRTRSFSGDLSSNLSLDDDDDSRYNETADITIRTKKGRSSSKSYRDSSGKDMLSPKAARKGRSRSTSREYDDGLKSRLERKRSKSLSQERISPRVREKIEKLGGEVTSKSRSKGADDNLKPPRRRRSRSASRDRSGKKSERSETQLDGKDGKSDGKNVSKLADHPLYSPALLEAVEDTIKRLVLPQLQDLKASHNRAKFDQTVTAAMAKIPQSTLGIAGDPKGVKSASMPDVSKPMVVLQPDFDKGQGQGFVVAGSRDRSPAKEGEAKPGESGDNGSVKSDNSYSRAPGLGPTLGNSGQSIHSVHSDRGEGVLLEQPKEVAPENRLTMPPMPLDYPESTYAETRASIRTEPDGLPYPDTADANGIPATGNSRGHSRATSIDSLDSIGGREIIREPESLLAPSTLHPDDHEDRPHSTSSLDSESRISVHSIQHAHIAQAKPIVVNSPSQMSIPSMSDTPSTKIARQRRKGKARDNFIGDADGDNDKEYAQSDLLHSEVAPPAKNSADWFDEQHGLAQQKDTGAQRAAAERMSAHDERSSENMQTEKVRTGQEVYGINAFNPSLVSTPFAIESNVASIRDGMSNLSFQTLPALTGATAYPDQHDPLPDVHGMDPDDDEITNPSDIQGPISHRERKWNEMVPAKIGSDNKPGSQIKDEGYASPGFSSPGPSALPIGGIDDMMSDDYNSPHRGRHSRVGSGGSHGMPDQLYDSSTGRGIDRIQSKDIVALMDHLTVRDAQRNARDTEILITLVRSAAEMRNSFEDLKKQIEQAQHEIVNQVDANTEKSVQKVLIGPRPQPLSAPRVRRSLPEGHEEEEAGKRKSMFKRALKGLSMKSANDLTRIEGMLEKLLDEVEGLKGGNEFYQQSILGTIENLKNTPPHTGQTGVDPAPSSTANSGYYTGTGPSAGTSNGPSRQTSGMRIYDEIRNHTNHRISPIEENGPTPPAPQSRSIQLMDTPQPAAPPTANSSGNTPTKPNDKPEKKRESNSSSIFPKISRWSETTTSSGMRGLLRKTKVGKESEASMSNSDFDFWAESGQAGNQPGALVDSPGGQDLQSPGLPPSSRGTDAPVNQATIRSSLEVKHPQPKPVYRHQLEQQAQQFINMDPAFNHSSPSLVRFAGQTEANGNPMSPMSDGYTNSVTDSNLPSARPPKILEEYEGTPSPGPLKEKKSKERNKDRTHRKDREKDRDGEVKDKEARRRERMERRERRERRDREKEKENGGERSHRSSRSKLKEASTGGEYLDTDFGRSEVDQVRPLFYQQSSDFEEQGGQGGEEFDDEAESPVYDGAGGEPLQYERGKRKKYYQKRLQNDHDDYHSDGVQSQGDHYGGGDIGGDENVHIIANSDEEYGGGYGHYSSRSHHLSSPPPSSYNHKDASNRSPSTTTRSVSNVSRLKGPRPQSSHSQHKDRSSEREKDREREKGADLETSGTVVRRHRNKTSHLPSGEFYN